jgi:hypothetical protein
MHSKKNLGYPNKKGVDNIMPNNSQETHSQSTPHPDGQYDQIIHDSRAGLDSQFGVAARPTDGLVQEKNPYVANFKQNESMKKLNRFVDGKDVE